MWLAVQADQCVRSFRTQGREAWGWSLTRKAFSEGMEQEL